MQEELIIQKVKNGEAEQFGLLVENYQNALFTFILYSVKNDGAAKDILQDTFVKAFEELPNYKEEGKFKAWLWTIARNKVMDFYRKNNKLVSLEEETLVQEDKTAQDAFCNIEFGHIQGLIANLPPEQKEVILMRQYLSFKEIASVLNCPLGTVLARLNRGIKKIQKSLGEEYGS